MLLGCQALRHHPHRGLGVGRPVRGGYRRCGEDEEHKRKQRDECCYTWPLFIHLFPPIGFFFSINVESCYRMFKKFAQNAKTKKVSKITPISDHGREISWGKTILRSAPCAANPHP